MELREFHAGMAREITAADEGAHVAVEGVEVIKIDPTDEADFERFLETYVRSWGREPTEESLVNPRCWRQDENWHFYLGRAGGGDAGAAILDVQDGAAVFASAGTVSEFRGRGVQAALLAARIRDAAIAGCDLMVGGAYFGAPSMRNQMRAGMTQAFTRAIVVPMTAVPMTAVPMTASR